ncbi:MAG: hydrogenase nickel incorporation protein HypB [Melioribacteraceae bacterium]|nr:hydrogenase nickel incorporation protein HypB [Melioribacteraceae bacterium]MCF8264600.1 hydrogenase nickel incorporation protein HypB [Melioribacteraceae bacterium]
MCDTCGCTQPDEAVTLRKPGKIDSHQHISSNHQNHSHSHSEHHSHNHHEHTHSKKISIETDILHKNDLIAERNRGYFEAKNIRTINLVSSPGSGKTSLLEKTLTDLKDQQGFYVIEGDQQTMNDANRIDSVGVPVIQVNTGNGCHLDSNMVSAAIKELNPENNSILMIENVGNLVCPSLFDLGETKRVVIISVTEGEDKPIKYPNMFQSSDLCIINKIDLLPYLDFDLEKMKNYAVQVNHHLQFIELSVKSGEGLNAWYDWLKNLKN